MHIAKLQDIKLTHRNPLHSYTLTMRKQKKKLGNNSIRHCNEKNKYFGIYLPKETKDLYIENYKTLIKKIRALLRVRTSPKALRAVRGSFFKLWESKEKLTSRNTLLAVCKTKGLRNSREELAHPRWR